MNISNNFYFFLLNQIILEKKNFFLKNIIKFFSLKRNFLIKNFLLKNSSFIFIINQKNLFLLNKILLLNKDNILFFYYNNRLYSNNFINIIIKENFLSFKLNKYIILFSNYTYFYIQKIIFLLKLKNYSKEICQH